MVHPYTGNADHSDEALFRGRRCDECRLQLVRWARRRLPNPADAEDLCQDICLRCRASCAHFRHESTFSTFLYPIKHYALQEFLRKRDHDLLAVASALDDESVESGTDEQLQILHDLEVREALAHLSIYNQALLIWKYVQGETAAEIGARLGILRASVDRQLSRARKQFRDVYGKLR